MSRYFCHTCNQRIPEINPNFTCPTCSTGFIEEIDDAHHSDLPEGAGGGAAGGGLHQFNPHDFLQLIGLDTSHGFPINSFRFPPPQQHHPASPTSTAPPSSATPTTPGTGSGPGSQSQSQTPGHGQSGGRGHHRGPHFSVVIDGRPVAGGGIGLNFQSGGGGGGGGGGGSDNPMENMFLSFISDLITGLGGGGGGQNMGGFPFPGNINLGDYAWGQGGLDAIVTQLMNNLEGTGPPPLSADRLSELNRIEITEEQVEAKLQCSVCWEDFSRGENVIRLDCEHIYHHDCIMPWLKLHATCPVCRKDLNLLGDPKSESETAGTEGGTGTGAGAGSGSTNSSGRSRSSSVPPPFTLNSASVPSSAGTGPGSGSNNNPRTQPPTSSSSPASASASSGGIAGRGASSSGALDEDMEFD